MNKETSKLQGTNEFIERRFKVSQEHSRIRHEAAEQTEINKQKRFRFLRRRLGLVATILTLGAGSAAGINALVSNDRDEIDHRVTVKLGDTLSGIAEKELMRRGENDPSTQDINTEVDELTADSPDISQDNSIEEGDVVVVKE